MSNRPFPSDLLELLFVVLEELRCLNVYGSECVEGHVRGLKKGPKQTKELGYRHCRAPVIMIKITNLPKLSNVRMENWGNELDSPRLDTKAAVTCTIFGKGRTNSTYRFEWVIVWQLHAQ